MSYDIKLEMDTGNGHYIGIEVDNYTYNIKIMWDTALSDNRTINSLNGMLAKDAISLLQRAVKDMEDNPITYRKMNPKNGWGNYEGALGVLSKLKQMCIKHPLTTIGIY